MPARVVGTLAQGLLAVSMIVSPRPAVALVKRAFDAGGAATAAGLARHAPTGVETREDERYGSGQDEMFDVHRPAGADGPLPVVLWIHGGGWVGGSKEELRDYLRLVAADGGGVVAPAYTLAPRGRYPGPLHQVAAALRHVCAHADELRLDADRIVVAGDSAGAQLAAQLATVITSPEYSQRVGVAPPVEVTRLHGAVLACGPYDIARLSVGADSSARPLMHAVLWAYSGRRRYARDRLFATASVLDHVTGVSRRRWSRSVMPIRCANIRGCWCSACATWGALPRRCSSRRTTHRHWATSTGSTSTRRPPRSSAGACGDSWRTASYRRPERRTG